MANQAGISPPANPAIGLGTEMTYVVIGVAPADLQDKVGMDKWQQAALGNFIGVQSSTTPEYSQNQPQVPDFDPTFLANAIDSMVIGRSSYVQTTAPDFFKFKDNTPPPPPVATTLSVQNAGSNIVVVVRDQYDRLMPGVAIVVTATGGTAPNPVVTNPNFVTNGAGTGGTGFTADGPGTITGTVTANVTLTQPFNITLN